MDDILKTVLIVFAVLFAILFSPIIILVVIGVCVMVSIIFAAFSNEICIICALIFVGYLLYSRRRKSKSY